MVKSEELLVVLNHVAELEEEVNRLRQAIGEDLAGRSMPELLLDAAQSLEASGGGPLADCLRAKAHEIEEALEEESGKANELTEEEEGWLTGPLPI